MLGIQRGCSHPHRTSLLVNYQLRALFCMCGYTSLLASE